MTTNNPNRYRVSTNFVLVKIAVLIGLFLIALNLIGDLCSHTFTKGSITALSVGVIALVGIFYFVSTRKRIDYDDIKQTVYIVDTPKATEIEIPVESIEKILFSAIGGRGVGSYVIVYKNIHNQKQKARLFPIPFDNSIETIKTDAKLKNPNLVTRNWSFGWNELFD